MTLAEQMADDVANVLLNTSEHAHSARYIAKGRDPVTVPVIINRGEDLAVRVSDASQDSVAFASIFCSTDDVPSPTRGDRFEVADCDDIWLVEERTSRDGYKGQHLSCVLVSRDTVGIHERERRSR